MSDLYMGERSISPRLKFQPIPVKDLIHSYENDEETEDTDEESDSVSDSEDVPPLPHDDSVEDAIDASAFDTKSPASKYHMKTSSSETKKLSTTTEQKCVEQAKVHGIISDIQDRRLLKDRADSTEEREHENCKVRCTNSQHNTVQTSGESAVSSSYESRRNTKPEIIKKQSCHENVSVENTTSDKDGRNRHAAYTEGKESKSYNVESVKYTQSRTSEGCISSEKPVKDHYARDTDDRQSQSQIQNPLIVLNRVSDSNTDAPTGSTNSVIDTPMKHPPISIGHPNPCHSRRSLIETPQNKLHKDMSKNYAQTPVSMLSHRSQSNTGRTPLQAKSMGVMQVLQTPNTPMYLRPSLSQHNTSRYPSVDGKNIRRPLADATSVKQNSGPIYPLDSKSLLWQGSHLSKVSDIAPPSRIESSLSVSANKKCDMRKRDAEVLEKPTMPTESHNNEPLKENKTPNNEIPRNEKGIKQESMLPKLTENNLTNNGNNSAEPKGNPLQKHEKISRISDSMPIKSEQPHVATSNQNRQYDRKEGVNKPLNLQYTVPNVPKTKYNETITVKGREYLILGTLGKGMSGEVLRVQDVSSRELCAIKCVNLSRMDKDAAQGCLDEISMLRKLQAPCVVKMIAYELKEPMVYVVMEMGDTDLSRLLKSMMQDKHLPLTMILYYWTEMLTAVKHIHDNDVIHSDLKPANFLLVQGRLKLIDFGIASSVNSDMTSVVKSSAVGTLNYISPEALMDIGGASDSATHNVKYKINFKSDVWSLGCILYSLVYGCTPFQHIRPTWAKVSAITNPDPNIKFPLTIPGTETVNSSQSTPPILIDVMRKCLQHDPKARPTVAQLLEVQYIPTTPNRTLTPVSDVPMSMIMQAKHVLNEDEWRQFTQLLEKVCPSC